MNPKVVSMFHNVRTFLSDQELAELGTMILDNVGKPKKEPKTKKYNVPTVEDYTAMLMAKQFRPRRTHNNQSK